jgi:hypothetical protein
VLGILEKVILELDPVPVAVAIDSNDGGVAGVTELLAAEYGEVPALLAALT